MKGIESLSIDKNTKKRIEESAIKEFMEKGFAKASLRQIVKNAGLTTGAFYKYYPTKDALFASLVEPYANKLYSIYDVTIADFQSLPASQQQKNMIEASSGGITEMLEYIYEHYDNFKLLLCKADGTPFTSFIHNLVEREVKSTVKFIDDMRASGVEVPEIDVEFVHMITSGMFLSVFEIVAHDMQKDIAVKRVQKIKEFYTGGWERMLGFSF